MIYLIKLQVPFSGLRAWLLLRFSSSLVQKVVPTMLGWKWITVDEFNTFRNESDRNITMWHIQAIGLLYCNLKKLENIIHNGFIFLCRC